MNQRHVVWLQNSIWSLERFPLCRLVNAETRISRNVACLMSYPSPKLDQRPFVGADEFIVGLILLFSCPTLSQARTALAKRGTRLQPHVVKPEYSREHDAHLLIRQISAHAARSATAEGAEGASRQSDCRVRSTGFGQPAFEFESERVRVVRRVVVDAVGWDVDVNTSWEVDVEADLVWD